MKRAFVVIAVAVSFFLFSGCSSIFMGVFGMKKPKELDGKAIVETAEKYNVPQEDLYELQKSYYEDLFKNFDSEKYEEEIKNRYQALQVFYYKSNGEFVSYHVNCHAGGFPNFRWNRNDEFEKFVPGQQAKLDQLFTFEDLRSYFTPLDDTKSFEVSNYDYVVIVFWSRYMGRQSKRLIKTVQENIKEHSEEQKVKVIYVNNDNVVS